MTSKRFFAGMLSALALGLGLLPAATARAEVLTFLGKSYCPIKY